MRLPHFSAAPADVTSTQRKNFKNVQIDAIGIGLANAAAPFLPVFLTRLNATNNQVGLLTSMPAITGLFFALLIGRFLQRQRNVVPWFSLSRLLVVSCYALTGLVIFFVPQQYMVQAVLLIWALATLPQIVVAVGFSVVMNAVAGPKHRFELMSRRWSILGLTTAISVAIVGKALDIINFPINYQVVFIGLSIGGLISFYFSSHIHLPDTQPPPASSGTSFKERTRSYTNLIFSEKDFVRFSIQRFVFLTGTMFAVPLFPLYYVRQVQASDTWIGYINTTQTAVLLIGYFLWTQGSRTRGSRFVLLWTTLILSIYPATVAMTQSVGVIIILAGIAGIFQAGVDLVFFDELMKTVPVKYSATFVSLAQSLQYLSSVFAPLMGTLLATTIGLSGALIVSGLIRLTGFGLFALWKGEKSEQAAVTNPAQVE